MAFELLRRVEQEDAYANLLLPRLLEKSSISGRDAGFIQELAFGTIRQKEIYQSIIEKASGRSLSDIDPMALIVLRLGAYQILDMRVPDHAAVNESVELSKKYGSRSASGFVNAVLRNISKKSKTEWLAVLTAGVSDADERLSIETSHPLWIVKAIKGALNSRSISGELASALEVNNIPARVSLAAMPGFFAPEDFQKIGVDKGPASPIGATIGGNPSDLAEVRDGTVRVQDQGSQLVTLALVQAEIQCEDQNWLDLCAGPGGKSALLAALAKQRGSRLLCNEPQKHRASLVRKALGPIDKSVEVMEKDGRELISEVKFSRILLDAPCTGLGALRRRPEARWRKSPDDLNQLTQLQRELLVNAWTLLAPGGVLAYVTCSPHLAETTAQVAWAEAKFGAKANLINANEILNEISPVLELNAKFKTAQLWPHRDATDAMFLALFRKSLG